jgi:hypothetical protein
MTLPSVVDRSPRWSKARRIDIVFGAAVAANLAPVLVFGFLPTRDGPAHTLSAALIRWLLLGQAGDAGVVRWNPAPVPNWLGQAIMAVIGAAIGSLPAERVLIALIAVSLPLALRFAIRAVTDQPTGLEFLALPLVWGTHLHWGFYNFCLSLTTYLVALGYWLRHRQSLDGWRLGGLAGLVVLCYFASVLAFAHLVATVCLLSALGISEHDRYQAAVRTGIAIAPAGLLLLLFLALRPADPSADLTFPSLLWAAASLVRLDVLRDGLVETDHRVTALMAAALWLLVASALLARSAYPWTRISRLMAAVFAFDLAVLLLAPTSVGSATLLTPRQAYFALFAVVLGLAASRARLPRPLAIVSVTLALTIGLHASRWAFYQDYDRAMRSFLAAQPAASDGRPFFAGPLGCEHPGRDSRGAICLSASAGGYVAVARHAIQVNEYELLTNHFPLVARQRVTVAGQSWAAGETPLDSALLWRGSLDERRSTARRLFDGREIGCEIPLGEADSSWFLREGCPGPP